MQRHLAPVIIPETIGDPPIANAAFKIVEELISAIQDTNVKNVAVSADYGAGKSSVVETAKAKIIKQEDVRWWRFCRKRRQTRFLTISLAQLNANDFVSSKSSKKKQDIIDRDKDIEYSLLQQLLYYDLPSKTPKSRFYRLGRIGIWRPVAWAISILIAAISYFILFEPNAFRVPSFYEHFAVNPEAKFWIDCAAAVILSALFVAFCLWLVRRARIRIGKVKVKDTEIEVDNLSVFNQYLDEIIYFFASTRYNVVIFEDLDRFVDTTRIFGKLRELNKILNSSRYLNKIIKREITFVYSLRDDLFDATLRVKFFDYIVPVIPVVNSCNAYEKLSEFLDEEDKRDFDGKDLLNLCEFFEDLRLIINIVNEYDLYKKIIRLEDLKLARKKLFGLIVYKNYCPQDFANLYNRRGILANILDNKAKIAKDVITIRKELKKTQEKQLEDLVAKSNEWERVLRKEYVDASKIQTNFNSSLFDSYVLQNGSRVPFERVFEDPGLFDELVNDRLSFYGARGLSYPIYPFANWQRTVSSKSFHDRLRLNPYAGAIAAQRVLIDSINLSSFSSGESFSSIVREDISVLDKYLEKTPDDSRVSIPKERHQLLRFLLTHDFLDEHYLDYITYFYQNSISIEDKRFILNITSLEKDSLPNTFHLKNPISVADRFDLTDYETNDRLLNVDLALSLTNQGENQIANRNALQRLAMNKKAVDFVLAVYDARPGEDVDLFLSELLQIWDFGLLIQSLEGSGDSRLQRLREINIRYTDLDNPEMINDKFRFWLNGHFSYLAKVFEVVGEQRLRALIDVYKPKFSKINLTNLPHSFGDFIISGSYYSINSFNIESIASFLGIRDGYNKASFTTLYKCNNQSLALSIRQQPQEFIKVFPSSSIEETPWAKAIIAAEDKISLTTKKEYLRRQTAKILDASDLKDSALDFVFKYSLVRPTWDNIYYLCFEKSHPAPLDFIKDNELEGFLSLAPEQQNEIISQWVFSNDLSFSVYEKVVSSMYGFRILEPGVEHRRIKVLILRGLLLFNVPNYIQMRNSYPDLAALFLTANIKSYLDDVTNYPVSSVEMMAVLASIDTKRKRAKYFADHPSFEGGVSQMLADEICELVYSKYLNVDSVDESLLIQSIRYSSKERQRLYVARRTLFDLPYTFDRCLEVLKAMGGEYSRICESSSYSWLSHNTNNSRLANYLMNNSFIRGIERTGDKIKVLK